jgi:transglutaminase-like putative cysteine protease
VRGALLRTSVPSAAWLGYETFMLESDARQSALGPTEFIDCTATTIRELAGSLAGPTPRETAVASFDWVRDRIRYDPYAAMAERAEYRASAVLRAERGYCVQKAVLLAALGRACDIPSRLGFVDVRNHRMPERLERLMGTNLFVFHGYVELWLDERWVKATPAFDRDSARRAGALLVELDGTNDAMLHPVDPEGHPHIEYVRHRGTYDELPFDELQAALRETYGGARPGG